MHIIANWKMNGDAQRVSAWMAALTPTVEALPIHIHPVFCPPTLLLAGALQRATSHFSCGAQDCHDKAEGAYTGETSAPMLAEAGARYVILGHSERRHSIGETSQRVAAKAAASDKAGLIPIICIGETRTEREANATLDVICAQLEASVPAGINAVIIAYEPVWAIGTGLTPTTDDITKAHAAIISAAKAHQLTRDRPLHVVYGGSVNSTNAASILALDGVDGALVGGASLDAAQFASILNTAAHTVKVSAAHM